MNLEQQIVDTIADLELRHRDWTRAKVAIEAIKACGIEIHICPKSLDAGMAELPNFGNGGTLPYAQLALAYKAIGIQQEKEYAAVMGDYVSC